MRKLPSMDQNDDGFVRLKYVRYADDWIVGIIGPHKLAESDSKVKGFTRLMAILNRKQIPVCEQCHLGIHSGKYDGLKLEDLAYDPRKPKG
jgi:hypothetical protein